LLTKKGAITYTEGETICCRKLPSKEAASPTAHVRTSTGNIRPTEAAANTIAAKGADFVPQAWHETKASRARFMAGDFTPDFDPFFMAMSAM
jgi:hypothetical protein